MKTTIGYSNDLKRTMLFVDNKQAVELSYKGNPSIQSVQELMDKIQINISPHSYTSICIFGDHSHTYTGQMITIRNYDLFSKITAVQSFSSDYVICSKEASSFADNELDLQNKDIKIFIQESSTSEAH